MDPITRMAALASLFLATAGPATAGRAAARAPAPDRGWRPLFDGRATDGWRGYRSKEVPAGWKVEDGTLTKNESAGDLVTRDEFSDFELELEWRLASGG